MSASFRLRPIAVCELIHEVEELPARLRQLATWQHASGMNDSQLDTRYKNWTVRQIVHHLADSHLNGYVRFRLTLTEDRPTIKNYDRARWAELSDSKTADVELSLSLLESLHARWAMLLRTLTDGEERADILPSETSARSSTR